MIFINYIFYLFIQSLLLGLLIIVFLIFKGNIERLCIIALTLITVGIFKNSKFKFNYTPWVLGGLVIGYILGNVLLYYSLMAYTEGAAKKEDINEEKLSKPAVIMFYGGEPSTFDLSVTLKNIYNDKSIIKRINAPIETFKSKMAYENLGSSKNIDLSSRVKDDLQSRLGGDYDVYLSYFNISPTVYEEVKRLGKAYEKLILVPLILTESQEYREFKKYIEERVENDDIDIKVIPLLWSSQKLCRQITERSRALIGEGNVNSTGVILLISNGDSIYEQSIFSNYILGKMQKLKFDKDKIISLKYDDNDELFLSSINRLRERGAHNIQIISISKFHEDIEVQNRINKLIKKASRKGLGDIQYINGWGIGENLLNEIEYKVRLENLKS